jgi:hypothetical protein
MPLVFVPDFMAHGVGGIEPLHCRGKVAFGSSHEQMEMVAQQAKGQDFQVETEGGSFQQTDEIPAVRIIGEYLQPVVAADYHMINRIRILNAPRPSHS